MKKHYQVDVTVRVRLRVACEPDQFDDAVEDEILNGDFEILDTYDAYWFELDKEDLN